MFYLTQKHAGLQFQQHTRRQQVRSTASYSTRNGRLQKLTEQPLTVDFTLVVGTNSSGGNGGTISFSIVCGK